MAINKEQIQKISKLVNLRLTEDETTKLSTMFSDTLDKMGVLKELDTSKVDESFSVTGTLNVFNDPSKNKITLTQEQALKNAHDPQNGLFGTSAVFDRE